MRTVVVPLGVLAILLALPGVLAQTELLTDEAGDVELKVYDNAQPMVGDWPAVDLVGLAFEETESHLLVHVTTAAPANCTGDWCPDAGDTRTYFRYGGNGYMVQAGKSLDDVPFGALYEWGNSTFDVRFIQRLDAAYDAATSTATSRVPRDMLLSAQGAPLRGGHALTEIATEAFNMYSLGGPDPNNLGAATEMFVVTDKMGWDARATYQVQLGGSQHEGDLRIDSNYPFRASNGGAATIQYKLTAQNLGAEEITATLEPIGLPSGWVLDYPEVFKLAPGTTELTATLTTPFGHQHGGSESFRLQLNHFGGNAWAWTELGISYLAIAQPAGHHDTVWFHGRAQPVPVDSINAALGGATGLLHMNTLEDDPSDERVPVQGFRGGLVTDQFHWSVCLNPTLALGLDFDLDALGELKLPISTTVPLQGATIAGEVILLGPGDRIPNCFPSSYADRDQTVLAQIIPSEPRDLQAQAILETTVQALEAGDRVPFVAGQQLVVELTLEFDVPLPASVGGAAIEPGATLRLPLEEYFDAMPAGVVGEPLGETQNDTVPAAPEEVERESPGAGILLAPAAGVAAWLRRRGNPSFDVREVE